MEAALLAQPADDRDRAAHPVRCPISPRVGDGRVGVPGLVQRTGERRDPRIARSLHLRPRADLAGSVWRGLDDVNPGLQVLVLVDALDQRQQQRGAIGKVEVRRRRDRRMDHATPRAGLELCRWCRLRRAVRGRSGEHASTITVVLRKQADNYEVAVFHNTLVTD